MEHQNKFIATITEIITGINVCYKHQLILPALILTYTTIDTMAYLNLPPARDSTTRADFIAWVDTYFLPESSLPCTALDLYAARCGLVHSLTAESDLVRNKKARPLVYCWGAMSVQALQQRSDKESRHLPTQEQPLAIGVEHLIASLKIGIRKFESEVRKNVAKACHVLVKADNHFTSFMM